MFWQINYTPFLSFLSIKMFIRPVRKLHRLQSKSTVVYKNTPRRFWVVGGKC
ncbi:MAG: hypothetical protein LBR79_04360 [Oscillospiraceae bacterium]|nr:hypothetical protein [Oscillospiraceae bacterium]